MKQTIQEFLDGKDIAIVGASTRKENFGRSLLKELSKLGYRVHPVNPGYAEVEGIPCVDTVKELPEQVENIILAVPPSLTEQVIGESVGSAVKRVWMIRGAGRGAYSEKAHQICRDNHIEVVYGFCPMMFFGRGFHRFHFWLRKNLNRLPGEYING